MKIDTQKIIRFINDYLHSLGYDNTNIHINGQRLALIKVREYIVKEIKKQ